MSETVDGKGECYLCNVCEEGYDRDYSRCHPPGLDLEKTPISGAVLARRSSERERLRGEQT